MSRVPTNPPGYKISLIMKYETNLYPGDYSTGTFYEGIVYVESETQTKEVSERFLQTGEIDLYTCLNRYDRTRDLSETLSTVYFLCHDTELNLDKQIFVRTKHIFGDGFRCDKKSGDKYFYWLFIENCAEEPKIPWFSERS